MSVSSDYWLEVAMPNGELLIWEYMKPRQILFLRNNYINQNCEVRTGKHESENKNDD
tara:strand:+ start:9388 stop:9558 length:171 start_codon:yes stop_codon:yes gene_type:complete